MSVTLVQLRAQAASVFPDKIQDRSLTLLTAAGDPIDLRGDGTVNGFDDLFFLTDMPIEGMATATGTVTLDATFDFEAAGVTQADIRLVDDTRVESAPLRVPVELVQTVGFGEMCDATHICVAPLACTAGACGASPEEMAACDAAPTLMLDDRLHANVEITLGSGAGLFAGSCGGALT